MKRINLPIELVIDHNIKRYRSKNSLIFKKHTTTNKIIIGFSVLLLFFIGTQALSNPKSSNARPNFDSTLNNESSKIKEETTTSIQQQDFKSDMENADKNLILTYCVNTSPNHDGTHAIDCKTDEPTRIYYEFFGDTAALSALVKEYELTELTDNPSISIRTGVVNYKNRLLAINMQEKSLLDISTTISSEKLLKWYKKSIVNQQVNQ